MKLHSFEGQKEEGGQGEKKNNAQKSIELSSLEVTPQGRIQDVDYSLFKYIHEDADAIRKSDEWKEAMHDLLKRKRMDVDIKIEEGVRGAIMDPKGYQKGFENYCEEKKSEEILGVSQGEIDRFSAVYTALLQAQERIEEELTSGEKTYDQSADKMIELTLKKALQFVQLAEKNTLEIEEFLDNKKNEILFRGTFGSGELEHEGN